MNRTLVYFMIAVFTLSTLTVVAPRAIASGAVPDPGSTPAMSISATVTAPPRDGYALKQFIVGFRKVDAGEPSGYLYLGTSAQNLRWDPSNQAYCPWLGVECDDQVVVDIDEPTNDLPYKVSSFSLGYSVKLDYTDTSLPGPEVGDVVTIKLAANAFTMPNPNTGWEPFIRFDDINPAGGNFPVSTEVATFALLPASPDTPATPTAVAGEEQATVTITLNTSGESVDRYRVTANPDGGTCTVVPPETACVVTGLEGGTSYTFTALALNSGLPSSASPSSNSVTPTATSTDSSDGGTSENSSSSNSTSAPGIMLEISKTSSASDATIVIGGTGIAPQSAYQLSLERPRELLNRGTTDSEGNFWQSVSLPSDLAPGSYLLTLTATAADGSELSLQRSLTVTALGGLVVGEFSDGSIQLARTGLTHDSLIPWLIGASVLIVLGASLIFQQGTRREELEASS